MGGNPFPPPTAHTPARRGEMLLASITARAPWGLTSAPVLPPSGLSHAKDAFLPRMLFIPQATEPPDPVFAVAEEPGHLADVHHLVQDCDCTGTRKAVKHTV